MPFLKPFFWKLPFSMRGCAFTVGKLCSHYSMSDVIKLPVCLRCGHCSTWVPEIYWQSAWPACSASTPCPGNDQFCMQQEDNHLCWMCMADMVYILAILLFLCPSKHCSIHATVLLQSSAWSHCLCQSFLSHLHLAWHAGWTTAWYQVSWYCPADTVYCCEYGWVQVLIPAYFTSEMGFWQPCVTPAHACMQHGKPTRCGQAELACMVLGVGNDMQHRAAVAIAAWKEVCVFPQLTCTWGLRSLKLKSEAPTCIFDPLGKGYSALWPTPLMIPNPV